MEIVYEDDAEALLEMDSFEENRLGSKNRLVFDSSSVQTVSTATTSTGGANSCGGSYARLHSAKIGVKVVAASLDCQKEGATPEPPPSRSKRTSATRLKGQTATLFGSTSEEDGPSLIQLRDLVKFVLQSHFFSENVQIVGMESAVLTCSMSAREPLPFSNVSNIVVEEHCEKTVEKQCRSIPKKRTKAPIQSVSEKSTVSENIAPAPAATSSLTGVDGPVQKTARFQRMAFNSRYKAALDEKIGLKKKSTVPSGLEGFHKPVTLHESVRVDMNRAKVLRNLWQ